MTVKLTTASGSIYELDVDGKRVRRLTGKIAPTPRQGADGEWKAFVTLHEVGDSLGFDWDGEGHCTFTSPVVKKEEVS